MINDRIIRIGLCAGILATAMGIVRVGVWPMDVPAAEVISPALAKHLSAAGWTLRSNIPAQSGQTVSWAKGYRFIRSMAGQPGLYLSLVSARVRGAKDLDALTIRKASLGAIKDQTRTIWNGRDELVLIQPKNGPLTVLSCLTNGEARSTSDALVKVKLEKDPANTMISRLRMVAGLQQPRQWSCLLVELKAANSRMDQADLLKAWTTIQAKLMISK